MARYDQTVYLYLTTVGRISGEPREIEIWFALLDGIYYLVAELGEDANWAKNIQRNPHVEFHIGKTHYTGRGRVVNDDEEPELTALVRAQFEAKYGWSDGLVVALHPNASPARIDLME